MADKNFAMKFEGLFDLDALTILEEDKNGTRLYKLNDAWQYFNGRNVKITITEKEPILPHDEE